MTLVFFVGGVTWAEVAALRWLGAQEDAHTEYVVAATRVLSGSALVEEFFEDGHGGAGFQCSADSFQT